VKGEGAFDSREGVDGGAIGVKDQQAVRAEHKGAV
jgi:hypothetical protein